jgi:hypothetical protein
MKAVHELESRDTAELHPGPAGLQMATRTGGPRAQSTLASRSSCHICRDTKSEECEEKVSVIHVIGSSAVPLFWNGPTSSIPKESCLPVSVVHSNPRANHARKEKREEALKPICRAPSNTVRPKRYKERKRPRANGAALLDWISPHQDRLPPIATDQREKRSRGLIIVAVGLGLLCQL